MGWITRVSRRYQVVIPKEVRKRLGINEGDRIMFEIDGDEIRIRKVSSFMSLAGILGGKLLSPGQLREKVEKEIARDSL